MIYRFTASTTSDATVRLLFFFFQAEDGIRDLTVTGVQTCALPICRPDVPRIEVKLDGKYDATAIIDSGAVLSIVSRSLAAAVPARRLGTFQGTFLDRKSVV